jgi:hypothetical protein
VNYRTTIVITNCGTRQLAMIAGVKRQVPTTARTLSAAAREGVCTTFSVVGSGTPSVSTTIATATVKESLFCSR